MNPQPTLFRGLLALAIATLFWGCAAKPLPAPSVEAKTSAWKIMEKQAQGHSPRGQFALAEPPEVIDSPPPTQDNRSQAERLPTVRLSLRMHNADVEAVLQALARAVGKSIVLSPGVTGTVSVNIVRRPWNEIFTGILDANKLTYVLDGGTIRVMAVSDMKAELELESLRRQTQAERNALLSEEPLSTSVAKIRFADAKELKPTLEQTLTHDKNGKPVGSVAVDSLTNSLIIQCASRDMPKITRLLSRLDAPRSQIKLKAHIVQTTREVARDLGILWGGNYSGRVRAGNNFGLSGGTTVSSTSSSSSSTTTDVVGGTSLGALAIGLPASTVASSASGMALDMTFGKTNSNILEAQLQALAKENKLNIISSPSISTMDNQTAYTEAGERVPYQTSTGTGTNVTYSTSFQDALLRLEITPHVIDDHFIRLKVLIQKDEVDTSRTVSGNPYILKKKTETTLIARNGETVVISGLTSLQDQSTESGVPGVKDVPVLGNLAKSEYKHNLKDEYMIFITPQVLSDWRPGEHQKTFEEIEREREAAQRAAGAGRSETRATRPEGGAR